MVTFPKKVAEKGSRLPNCVRIEGQGLTNRSHGFSNARLDGSHRQSPHLGNFTVTAAFKEGEVYDVALHGRKAGYDSIDQTLPPFFAVARFRISGEDKVAVVYQPRVQSPILAASNAINRAAPRDCIEPGAGGSAIGIVRGGVKPNMPIDVLHHFFRIPAIVDEPANVNLDGAETRLMELRHGRFLSLGNAEEQFGEIGAGAMPSWQLLQCHCALFLSTLATRK